MERITVADVMTREAETANPEDSALDCARKMVKKKVGSLILVEEKRVVGFLSEKDILWALVKKSKLALKDIKAKDIAAKKVATVSPKAPIQEAIQRMKKKKFKRLPVVEKGKLVGIITVKDILTFKPEFYPELDEIAKIKEEQEKLKRIGMIKGEKSGREGICEECGERDFLYRFNGMLICESCRNSA